MLREKLTTSSSLHHSYGGKPLRHSPISHSRSILALTPQASRSTLAHSHSRATYYCSASPCLHTYIYSCQPHKLTCIPLNSIGSHQEHPPPSTSNPTQAISVPGPFNSTAALPSKLAKCVLNLEFIEISDITMDDPPPSEPGRPPAPAHPPITNISQWVERFSLMATVICTRFPDRASGLQSSHWEGRTQLQGHPTGVLQLLLLSGTLGVEGP